MDEAEALPDVLSDLIQRLLRQGFTVTDRREPDRFGDQLIELRHGHRGVLINRDRGHWSVDVRLIDRWFAPTSVEAALNGVKRVVRPVRPPTLEEQALSTVGVIDAMPTSAAAVRELRDQLGMTLQRRRAPFLGSWGRRDLRR
jgi:hypothetical protein